MTIEEIYDEAKVWLDTLEGRELTTSARVRGRVRAAHTPLPRPATNPDHRLRNRALPAGVRLLRELPHVASAFDQRRLSYTKVRTLTRFATPHNEAELIELAVGVPASALTMVLARWMHDTWEPEAVENYQHLQRSVRWRTEADGMTTFTLRLPPHIAAILISLLTTMVMKARPKRQSDDGTWPTVAQQHADAIIELFAEGVGSVDTEVVLHVRAGGCSTDDGTPVPETVIASLVPDSFIRVLIHDVEGDPVDASSRRRYPTARQKRVVKERDRCCVDCGRSVLLEYDHVPGYETTGHTVTDQLELRCATCHHNRHRQEAEPR